MRTATDAEIVRWIGQMGAAGPEHVAERHRLDRNSARELLASLRPEGLLDRREDPDADCGLYWASEAGLACFGLEHFGVWSEPPEGVERAWLVAQVAVELEQRMPGWDVMSARRIAAIESHTGKQLASARIGGDGEETLHVPALALHSPTDRVVPVEVQSLLATEADVTSICRGWSEASDFGRVYWVVRTGHWQCAVRRAVRAAEATDRVTVLKAEEISQLVTSESDRERRAAEDCAQSRLHQ